MNISGGTLNSDQGHALYVGHSVDSTAANPYEGGAEVSVTNGTFNADVYVADKLTGETAPYPENFISGGTFSEAPADEYLSSGMSAIPNGVGGFTTAPTASVPTSGSKEAYYTADFTNYAMQVGCDVVNNKYELKTYFAGSEQAKMFAQVAIWRTPKVLGGTQLHLYPYTVAVSADSATLAFVEGSNITYLNPNYSTWVGTATLVETVDFADAEKCGDVFTKNDVAVYKDVAGKLYVENKNGDPYNVNGKLVLLKPATEDSLTVKELAMSTAADFTNDVIYTVKHTYDYNVQSVNGKQTVLGVFCTVCKDDFDFVAGTPADAIAKFKAGNFVDTGLRVNGTTVVWAEKDGTSVGSTGSSIVIPSGKPSTDKVTSADTFDAGIAMYVGMSVMAAAGSAVVIGKKKD